MTEKLLLTDDLTNIAVLSEVKLKQDSHETPDNLFIYIEERLSSLIGFSNLAYAMFNPNSLWLRRNPVNNTTLYNIDLPRYGTTPSLEHKMIGTRTHIDVSLAVDNIIYLEGQQNSKWSGMNWKWTDDTMSPEGVQVEFTTIMDSNTKELDKRFAKELFW